MNNYVRQPNLNAKTSGLWTNNTGESINNVLKINTNWKPQSLTALIEKLFSVYTLTPDMPCTKPVISVCTPNTQCMLYKRQYGCKEQKDNAFDKFLKEKEM